MIGVIKFSFFTPAFNKNGSLEAPLQIGYIDLQSDNLVLFEQNNYNAICGGILWII